MDDITKWENIPKKLKIILMYHWFSFYSSIEYTDEDVITYEKIAQKQYDKIFDLIVSFAITMGNIDSTGLIICMRENKLEELLDSTLDRSLFKGIGEVKYENTRMLVLGDLLRTYFIAAMLHSSLNDDDNEDENDDNYKRTR